MRSVPDKRVALLVIGEHGNLGLWPAGGSEVQWWFDLPWSHRFVRPERPIDVIRSHFTGWCDAVDASTRNVDRRGSGRFAVPAFSPSDSPAGPRPLTLLGDAAHTMPPTLAQGTNQALLDTMVLCKALSDYQSGRNGSDLSNALRSYEKTRRRSVSAVSRVTSLQVSHGESVLRPAAVIPDRYLTWALTTFLSSVSHRRMSAEISRDLAAASSR